MTLSQRIVLAKAEQENDRGYCPLCLDTGHKPGACLLQHH